ncbi:MULTISPECIES: phosphopantetheine-binding protein [Protofrankia]|uniref:Phosphopantetheine-binding protein n=1 Tax=Protofrankia coriariae TaxID=1562887 RepID=A0ABR5F239_9ACTN|nr:MULTISPECIES: phosphopantetheine-binding protein [Protofrankia]KLL10713.1 phosphopantetheine-binding protein [Protofrankia coriariae]ONH34424.1 phosphopantetheine-binding protein [Protofrankia sp. BMG5.30]
MADQWTADQLLDFLVERTVLVADERPDHLGVTFAEVGVDSLAYLHLQTVVLDTFGVELPAEPPEDYTLAEILTTINSTARAGVA